MKKAVERTEVSEEVVKNIKKYFEKELPLYDVVKVLRASEHPGDHFLYHVIAKKITQEEYACWTCWNETTQCLNFGHYGLKTKEVAMEVCDEFYHRI